jgi:3-hydroxyisobutyrate dehydrogenase-like beta-hydroxyacid dehydrogenase
VAEDGLNRIAFIGLGNMGGVMAARLVLEECLELGSPCP